MTLRREKGVALMLALWLIVLMSVVGARVVSSSRSTSGLSSNLRARTLGRYAAESGIVLGAARVRDSLAKIADVSARAEFLNSLEPGSLQANELASGDARFSIVYVDVNARLDINNSSQAQLTRLFSYFVGPVDGAQAARAVRSWIDADDSQATNRRYAPQRTDITYPRLRAGRPLRTLEELRRIPGISERLTNGAAPFLTVDGDGRINRAAASDTVLSAAAGSLVDEPSRILIVARGWENGHPLTHEIQAVYAIEGSTLVLVRWQERDL